MAKVKNHIIEDKSDYLLIAIDIGICLFCVFMIGRVGVLGKYLSLFFAFIVGDYSTFLLCVILFSTVMNIIFKKKVDMHHIFFIGAIFIFLGLLMLTHIGLYDSLGMDNKNILAKTLNLYKHYLKNYEMSYSCGGGLIGGALLQVSCLLTGKIGGAIIGVALILIGLSYFTNVKLFSIFSGGKITLVLKNIFNVFSNYFKNIKFPSKTKTYKTKPTINDLEDVEIHNNFVLQNEINKEKFEDFKRYIKENKMYILVDKYYTSYSSSRFVLKFANITDEELKLIINYFNRQAFIIKNTNEYYLDFPNQFRKLLTLKNVLSDINKEQIPLLKDINGNNISFDYNEGKNLVLIGDENSGIKTCIKSIIASFVIKGVNYTDIYFYDFHEEFKVLLNSKISYVIDEKGAINSLNDLFNEYEKRLEVLKYFNSENIKEVNSLIRKNNMNIENLSPIVHILNVDLLKVSDTLLSKLIYAIRFSSKVGINIIVVARNKNELMKLELNKMDILCMNINDISTSIKLFGSDMALRLLKKGDVLLRMNNYIYHGQTPYISTTDFEKICFK